MQPTLETWPWGLDDPGDADGAAEVARRVVPDERRVELAMAQDHRSLTPHSRAVVAVAVVWLVPALALLATGSWTLLDPGDPDRQLLLARSVAASSLLAAYSLGVGAVWTFRAWRNAEALGTDLSMRWGAAVPLDAATVVPACVVAAIGSLAAGPSVVRSVLVLGAGAVVAFVPGRALARLVVELWRSSAPLDATERPPRWVSAWWWASLVAGIGTAAVATDLLAAAPAGALGVASGSAGVLAAVLTARLALVLRTRQQVRLEQIVDRPVPLDERRRTTSWGTAEALARFNELYHQH